MSFIEKIGGALLSSTLTKVLVGSGLASKSAYFGLYTSKMLKKGQDGNEHYVNNIGNIAGFLGLVFGLYAQYDKGHLMSSIGYEAMAFTGLALGTNYWYGYTRTEKVNNTDITFTDYTTILKNIGNSAFVAALGAAVVGCVMNK